MKKNEISLTATGVATRLNAFCGMITHLFAPTKKRAENNAVHAKTYLRGLLSETPRKNSEAIADAADDTEAQDIQNFMTGSHWQYDDVFAHAAKQANQRIGNHPDTMLAIDESGFTKKGDSSAGVIYLSAVPQSAAVALLVWAGVITCAWTLEFTSGRWAETAICQLRREALA